MKQKVVSIALYFSAIGLIFTSCQRAENEAVNQSSVQHAVSTMISTENNFSHERISVTFTTESGRSEEVIINRYKRPVPGPATGENLPNAVVFVHGMAHNAEFFTPLINELKTTGKYDQYITINLPGHGGKSWATGKRYGDLSLEDYISAVEGSLNYLTKKAAEPVHISTICGHSMGANLLIRSQDKSKGAYGFKKRYDIDNVILLSASIPGPLSWFAADVPVAFPTSPKAIINSVTVRTDTVKGPYLNPTPELYIGFFYATRAGIPVSAALFPDILKNMETEPYAAVAELMGLSSDGKSDLPRVQVNKNIFKYETLTVVTCSEDPLTNKSEQDALANYLKNEEAAIEVVDPLAVHGMPFTDPKAFVRFF